MSSRTRIFDRPERERNLKKRDIDEVISDEISRYKNHILHSTKGRNPPAHGILSFLLRQRHTEDPLETEQDKIWEFLTAERELLTAELMKQDKEMEKAAIERAEGLDTTFIGKYSIWRRDYDNSNTDSTLKLMRDQIIMAKAYATIAKTKNESSPYNSLMKCNKDSLSAIGDANSDADLLPSALFIGMNMFDLKEWRKRNITGIYHHWQELNEDRTPWKLGSLPLGLITYYNLMTYQLDRSWHVLGLGYDSTLNQTAIGNAAVVHDKA